MSDATETGQVDLRHPRLEKVTGQRVPELVQEHAAEPLMKRRACVEDPCNGISCPNGATCHRGICGEDGEDPGEGEGAVRTDGGFGVDNSGAGAGNPNNFLAGDGCACSTTGAFGPGHAFGLLLLGLGGIMRRRRPRQAARGESN